MTYITPHTKRGKIRRLLSLYTAALLLATLSACKPPAPHEPTGATLPVEAEVNWELSWMSTPLANEEQFYIWVDREAFAVGDHMLLNTCDTLTRANPSVKAVAYDIGQETLTELGHAGYLVGVSHTEDKYELLFQDKTTFTLVCCDAQLHESRRRSVVFRDFPRHTAATSWCKAADGTQYLANAWGILYQYDPREQLIARNEDADVCHLMLFQDRLFGFGSSGEPRLCAIGSDLSATEISIAGLPHDMYSFSCCTSDCFYISGQK